jgi:hypothetical protein
MDCPISGTFSRDGCWHGWEQKVPFLPVDPRRPNLFRRRTCSAVLGLSISGRQLRLSGPVGKNQSFVITHYNVLAIL